MARLGHRDHQRAAGARLTNSMCFSGCSLFGASTTLAQRDRPDSSVVACSSASVTLRPTVAARLDALALLFADACRLRADR